MSALLTVIPGGRNQPEVVQVERRAWDEVHMSLRVATAERLTASTRTRQLLTGALSALGRVQPDVDEAERLLVTALRIAVRRRARVDPMNARDRISAVIRMAGYGSTVDEVDEHDPELLADIDAGQAERVRLMARAYMPTAVTASLRDGQPHREARLIVGAVAFADDSFRELDLSHLWPAVPRTGDRVRWYEQDGEYEGKVGEVVWHPQPATPDNEAHVWMDLGDAVRLDDDDPRARA